MIVCGTLRFVSGDLSQSPVTESDVVTENQPSTSGTQPAVHEASTDTPADIGVFVGDPSSATDGQKYALLKTRQIPVFPGNNWPHETRSGKKRHLNARHFEIHGSWLCYSHEPAGLFCKVCLFFADRDAVRRRNGSTAPVTFINKGCTRYSRLTGSEGYFDAHCNTNYHKDASLVALDFIYAFEHPAKSIDQQLDKQVHQRVAENRKRLKPIVSTIVFAGRMGLPLRGHRDSGSLTVPETVEDIDAECGNLRALLQFRAVSGDEDLKEHLISCKKNATYLGMQSQNEIIGDIGDQIQQTIVKKIKKARFFTVIADETTDVSRKEQMSLCARFVTDGRINEEFLAFVEVKDLTGSGLAEKILSTIRHLGLDPQDLVGQSYDGASAMSGVHSGVQSRVRELFPRAIWMHCASHCLNLVISSSSNVPAITAADGLINKVANHLRRSAKRSEVFKAAVEAVHPETSHTVLPRLSDTRWVERHDAVLVFAELYDSIAMTLEQISQWNDREAASEAICLLAAISRHEFVISLQCLKHVLILTKPVSIKLQAVDLELVGCLKHIRTVCNLLQTWRDGSGSGSFDNEYKDAEEMVGELRIDALPSASRRRRTTTQPTASDPKTHYLHTVYLPFLDYLLQDFNDRFLQHSEKISGLARLLPSSIHDCSLDPDDICDCLEFYGPLLPSSSGVAAEIELWQQKWVHDENAPSTAVEALEHCDPAFFSNVSVLLTVLATLPVTTCSAERSFSVLRLLKTYLRSRMGEERLTGLAMMYVHSDLKIDLDDIINRFSQKNRRLEFQR